MANKPHSSKTGGSIVLIGAGNVGFHLGRRLRKRHQNVVQVFSRQPEKAKRLSEKIDADWTTELSQVIPNADVYILAVHDDSLSTVAARIAKTIDPNSLVVHTSGATPGTILQPHFKRHGVFYPLQTFSISPQTKMV